MISTEQSTNIETGISATKRTLDYLRKAIASSSPSTSLQQRVTALENTGSISISGIQGSLASLVVAELSSTLQRPVIIIGNQEALDIYDNDLKLLLDPGSVTSVADELSPSLCRLKHARQGIILAEPDDFRTALKNPDILDSRLFQLQVDDEPGYSNLIGFLEENGFKRKEFVHDEGDYSTRGSIIDIYPFGADDALRIEFFGDTVTSVRTFDINSQRSKSTISSYPLAGNFLQNAQEDEQESWHLADYISSNTVIFIDNELMFAAGEQGQEFSSTLEAYATIAINRHGTGDIDFASTPQENTNANFSLLAARLSEDSSRNLPVIFVGSSKKEVDELSEFITDEIHSAHKGSEPLPALNWIPANLYAGFRFENCSVYSESDIFGKLHQHKKKRRKAVRGISLKDLHRLKVGDYIVHEDYGVGIFKAMETIEAGDSEQECVLIEYDKGDQLYVNVQNIRLLSKYSASEGSSPTLSRLGSSKWSAKKEKVKNRLKDIASELIKLYAKRKMTPGFAFGQDSIFQREFEAAFIFTETPDQLKAIEDVKKDMQDPSPMDRLICGDAGFGKTEIAMRAAFKAVESKKQVAILTPTTILAHQHLETFRRRFANFPITIEILSRFVPRKEQKRIIDNISKGLVDIVIGTHRLVSKDVLFQDLGLLVIDEEQHFGVTVKEKLRTSFPGVDTLTMSATPIPRTLQFSMLGARDISIVSTPPRNRQPVETVITPYDPELVRTAIEHELSRNGQVFVLHNRISGLDEFMHKLHELVPSARMATAHGQMPGSELENIMMDFISHELDVLISTSIIGSGLDISNANTIIINRADMFGLADLYQLRGRVGRSDRKAYSYLITPPMQTLKEDAIQRLAVIESFTELGSGFTIAMRDLDIRGAGNLLGAEQSGAIHELGFSLYQKLLEEAVAELKSGVFSSLFAQEGQAASMHERNCDLSFFFDALIPDYYISSAQERFAFYERISKAATSKALNDIEAELKDRFGQLPEEVRNLLHLSEFKQNCQSLGLQKIDLQPETCAFTLPGQDDEEFYRSRFFQNLIGSVQQEWMQVYAPRFREGRHMKLTLHHPAGTDTSPTGLMATYSSLIRELERKED
ncbi:transcription-repair coupling factor [Prosthecochloris vibrioformis]|uniref:Transcription-repair-coupling factor n=1 Tax=Prosthecochloris vibrioformis TaxID=1098 RepID=A0A5C4RZS1_PROVB|nr:transcription-repair coupling factor [Prosthecochloris vibrioformis]TNJ36191.1 transcription-repair coupling factor [Prosthecochloris vibrioformis]